MRTCRVCGEEREDRDFYAIGKRPDGTRVYRTLCRYCYAPMLGRKAPVARPQPRQGEDGRWRCCRCGEHKDAGEFYAEHRLRADGSSYTYPSAYCRDCWKIVRHDYPRERIA